jgi:hypothetical protein
MFNLIINNTHVANSLNNMYQYSFKNGSFEVPPNSEMMITSVQIPYSWYNVTTRYNNQTFKIYWPSGAGYTAAYTVTIPEGFYSTTALNSYIQQFCIENKLYLKNPAGDNVYYISIAYNPTYYANQIILKTVPTALPTIGGTWTNPGMPAFPTAARTPYIEILSTSHFGKLIGFKDGNYGQNQAVDFSVNSNLIPKGANVNSLVIKCSLVNNGVSNVSDTIDSFAIDGQFGANLNYTNNIEKWVNINPGRYNNFIVTIVDQNYNDIQILDNNLLINFLIRVKS